MDITNYLRFVAALAFVLALIGLAAWAARRFGFGARAAPIRRGDRRLEVLEVASVGGKHRAVLLRRDRIEHLVLLGPNGDLLVESGIDTEREARRAENRAADVGRDTAGPTQPSVPDTNFAPLIPGGGQ